MGLGVQEFGWDAHSRKQGSLQNRAGLRRQNRDIEREREREREREFSKNSVAGAVVAGDHHQSSADLLVACRFLQTSCRVTG
jgi:hypothetical protein